jgi:hypothetical protein
VRQKASRCLGAIAAVSMLTAQIVPATAFTLSSPAGAKVASTQTEKVWWCRWGCGPGWGWRRPGWGYWGPGAVVGGLAAGAVVGAAVAGAAPVYAPVAPVYGPGPCWRRWIGPYGGVHWARVC